MTDWGTTSGTTTEWDGVEVVTGLSGTQVDTSYQLSVDYKILDSKRLFFGDDENFAITYNATDELLEIENSASLTMLYLNQDGGLGVRADFLTDTASGFVFKNMGNLEADGHIFSIKYLLDENKVFTVDYKGTVELALQDTEPTSKEGGIYYNDSQNDFYLGFSD